MKLLVAQTQMNHLKWLPLAVRWLRIAGHDFHPHNLNRQQSFTFCVLFFDDILLNFAHLFAIAAINIAKAKIMEMNFEPNIF